MAIVSWAMAIFGAVVLFGGAAGFATPQPNGSDLLLNLIRIAIGAWLMFAGRKRLIRTSAAASASITPPETVVDNLNFSPFRLRYGVAIALAILTLATPPLLRLAGYELDDVTSLIKRAALLLAILGVLAWLVARKTTPRAQANAMVAVAALAMVAIAAGLRDSHTAAQTRTFMVSFVKQVEKEQAATKQVAAKMERLDLSTAISPASLTSAAGRAASLKKIDEAELILKERQEHTEQAFARLTAFIEQAQVGDLRVNMLSKAKTDFRHQQMAITEVNELQLKQMQKLRNLLNWSATNSANLHFRDGALSVANETLRRDYLARIADLKKLEAELFVKAGTIDANAARAQVALDDSKLKMARQ